MKALTATRWGPMMVIAFAIVALALASPQAAAKSDGVPQYANSVTIPCLDSDGPQALKPATVLANYDDMAAAYAETANPATPSGGPMARHVMMTTSDFGVAYAKTIGIAGAATANNDVKTKENGPIAGRTNV